jgi:hypothetical protein
MLQDGVKQGKAGVFQGAGLGQWERVEGGWGEISVRSYDKTDGLRTFPLACLSIDHL